MRAMSEEPLTFTSGVVRGTSDGREDRVLDYYKNEMAKTNTMLYLTRVSFCIFVVFAMFLLGMLFFFHVSRRENTPPVERIIYQNAPSVECILNGSIAAPSTARPAISSQSTSPSPSTTRSTSTSVSATSPSSTTKHRVDKVDSEIRKPGPTDHLVFCFFNHTSYRRKAPMSFGIQNIPVALCSHIIYSSAGLDSAFLVKPTDEAFDIRDNGFEKFVALKEQHSKVKFLVSIGEGRDDWRTLHDVVSDEGIVRSFIQNLVRWVTSRKFDGVVLNWMFPRKGDRTRVTEMVLELKTRFTHRHCIVAVNLPHQAVVRRIGFEVARLADYADYLLFRMFSDHNHSVPRTTFPVTNEDVTLFPKAVRSEVGGKHFDKVCFVLPLYGLTYTLRRRDHRHVGAAVKAPGLPGRYTRTPGLLAYNEICSSNWTAVSTELFGTFAVKGSQWVGYHDPTNLRNIMRMVKNRYAVRCFGLWEIGYDDFRGQCGSRFPILQKCYRNLRLPNENTAKRID